MNVKTTKKPIISFILAGSLMLGVSSFAEVKAETVLKDGEYTETITVTPDSYGDFTSYDLSVNVVIKDGAVDSITLPDSNTYGGSRSNKNYSADAADGIVVNGVKTAEEAEAIDAVSECTCSSNAIKSAVKSAIEEAKVEIKTTTSSKTEVEIQVEDGVYDNGATVSVSMKNISDDSDYKLSSVLYGETELTVDDDYVYSDMNLTIKGTDNTGVGTYTVVFTDGSNNVKNDTFVLSSPVNESGKIIDNELILPEGIDSETYIENIKSVDINGQTIDCKGNILFPEGTKLDVDAEINESGNVTILFNGDGSYEVTVHSLGFSDATGTVIKKSAIFEDVQDSSKYYYAPVYWAVKNGITSGTSATTFSPKQTCTRAQIVMFIWRAMGSPEAAGTVDFSDVESSSSCYKAVQWAVSEGITSGTSGTTFSPKQTCTRAEIMMFLWRAYGSPKAKATVNFTDIKTTNYYYTAVQWAVKNGITSGTSETTFSPKQTCTRGQAMTFLYKAYKLYEGNNT